MNASVLLPDTRLIPAALCVWCPFTRRPITVKSSPGTRFTLIFCGCSRSDCEGYSWRKRGENSSIDGSLLHTFVFGCVSPEFPEKWTDTLLAEINDEDEGYDYRAISKPNWDEYWFFLAYALHFDDSAFANPPAGIDYKKQLRPVSAF